MAKWDNKAFDEAATKIAAAFWAGVGHNGSSLTDLVTKTARDNNLNPEQITRLARISNTKAFEAKFAAMKGAPDRVVEFALVEAPDVIGVLHKEASPTEKTAAYYPSLNDEMAAKRGSSRNYFDEQGLRDKTAADAARLDTILGKMERPDAVAVRYHKIAQELSIQVKQAEHDWERAMGELKGRARRVYWDHDEFEKNALATLGEGCLPELNALRASRRMSQLVIPAEKTAAFLDRLVGEETYETRLVKQAMTARTAYSEHARAHTLAVQRLTEARKAVSRG